MMTNGTGRDVLPSVDENSQNRGRPSAAPLTHSISTADSPYSTGSCWVHKYGKQRTGTGSRVKQRFRQRREGCDTTQTRNLARHDSTSCHLLHGPKANVATTSTPVNSLRSEPSIAIVCYDRGNRSTRRSSPPLKRTRATRVF